MKRKQRVKTTRVRIPVGLVPVKWTTATQTISAADADEITDYVSLGGESYFVKDGQRYPLSRWNEFYPKDET